MQQRELGEGLPRAPHAALLALGLEAASRSAVEQADAHRELVVAGDTDEAVRLLASRSFGAVLVDARDGRFGHADLDRLWSAAPAIAQLVIARSDLAESLTLLRGSQVSVIGGELAPADLSAEVRRSLRTRLFHRRRLEQGAWQVEAEVEGRRRRFALVDLSNRGLALELAWGEAPLLPGDLVERLAVVGADGRPQLEVERALVQRVESGAAGSRVGLAFEAPRAEAPSRVATTTEPLRILATLRKATRAKAAFTATVEGLEEALPLGSGAVDERSRLVFPPLPAARLAPYDVVQLAFSHHGLSHSARCAVVETGGVLALSLPRALHAHHRRGSMRYRPGPGRSWRVRLRAELTGLDGVFPVHDLNATGVSALVDEELVPPGLVLSEVTLLPPDGRPPLETRGVVRTVGFAPDAAGRPRVRCGIELADPARTTAARLAAELVAEGFPQVEPAAAGEFDDVWRFLHEAGFRFHLYADGSDAARLTARLAQERLLGAGRDLSTSLIFRAEDRLRGHIQAVRVYSRTWLLTHLAAMQAGEAVSSGRISRALCMGIVEQAEAAGAEFVKLMWQRDLAWASRMFGASGRAAQKPHLAEYREFAVLVGPTSLASAAPEGFELGEATAEELALAARHVARQGPVRARSEDLTADELLLPELSAAYRRAGLERRRRVRVARRRGVPVAFALVEETSAAVQLAEVTNRFELHTLEDGDAGEARLARRALACDAAALARARGLPAAVSLSSRHEEELVELGFRVAGLARSWTWHRSIFRAWADVWDELFESGPTKGAPSGVSRRAPPLRIIAKSGSALDNDR